MTVIERFQHVMEHFGLNAGTFAERIGVSQATISHIINGRNKYPSTEVLLRLHDSFPSINLNWIITGEGASGLDENDKTLPTGEESSLDEVTSSSTYNDLSATEETAAAKYRKENGSMQAENTPYGAIKQEIVYRERPQRKITEIRIFFDDNTFETFTP